MPGHTVCLSFPGHGLLPAELSAVGGGVQSGEWGQERGVWAGHCSVEFICMRLSVNVVQRCRRDSLLCDSKETLAVTSYHVLTLRLSGLHSC